MKKSPLVLSLLICVLTLVSDLCAQQPSDPRTQPRPTIQERMEQRRKEMLERREAALRSQEIKSAESLKESHVYTDKQGNQVTGKIQTLEAGPVAVIRTESGQAMKARLEDLSEEDQKLIRIWYVEQMKERRLFQLTVKRGSGTGSTTSEALPNDTYMSGKVTKRGVDYEISLRNLSPLPLEDLQVDYAMHIISEGALDTVQTGSAKVADIAPGGKAQVTTTGLYLTDSAGVRTEAYVDDRLVKGTKGKTSQRTKGYAVTVKWQGILIAATAEPSSLLDVAEPAPSSVFPGAR